VSYLRVLSGAPWRRAALLVLMLVGYLAMTIASLNGRVDHQIAVTGHPFVHSDLFPRWLGAQTVLSGGDPYDQGFTSKLQGLMYGRPYDAAEEIALLRGVTGFFYPPYVVITLLPLLWLPFEVARWAAVATLAASLTASAFLWLRLTGRFTLPNALLVALVLVTFQPVFDLLWLQQLTGAVLIYLVGAYAAAARHR